VTAAWTAAVARDEHGLRAPRFGSGTGVLHPRCATARAGAALVRAHGRSLAGGEARGRGGLSGTAAIRSADAHGRTGGGG
jgi:hypothetical protein